jgi:hypothetical protein
MYILLFFEKRVSFGKTALLNLIKLPYDDVDDG